MTERSDRWLARYLQCGDAKQAVREVYRCSEKSVPVRASQLKARYQAEIVKALSSQIATDSVRMYSILKGLATDASSETVKLNAAKDLLDRAGFKPDSVVRLEQKPMSRQEILEKVEQSRLAVIRSMSAEEIMAALKVVSTDEGPHHVQRRQISFQNPERTDERSATAEENKEASKD